MKMKITALLIVLFALTGCPSDNTVDTSRTYSSTATSGSTTVAAIVSALKSQSTAQSVTCDSGTWIDLNVSTTNIASPSTIVVSDGSNGTPLSGTVSEVYIGVSAWKDLLIVCKMASGAFNVTVSMCPFGSIITTSRAITKFQTPNGIVLASTTYSGLGTILAATNTYVYVEGSPEPVWFGPTTFTKVNISN